MKRLNLGCGTDIRKGYVNLDNIKMDGVDMVHDLNEFPYPFKDNEFDEILCMSVLEHLDDIVRVMKELHRILEKGGVLIIKVPHFTSINAYKDPTHRRFFQL